MLRTSSPRAFAAVAALLVACGGATATVGDGSGEYRLKPNPDGSPTGDGVTCSYGGTQTAVGDTFKAPDGCNECRCTARGAACTERACGGGTCLHEGVVYRAGESWTIPNPSCPVASTHCTCEPTGAASCTTKAIACVDAGPAPCGPEECGPAPGMPNHECADGTTAGPGDCERQESGACGWTIRKCTCKDAQGVHQAGETWSDGCNSCTCSESGAALCTKKACQCPQEKTINCMPPVPENRTILCSGAHHEWIKANCPDVQFVY